MLCDEGVAIPKLNWFREWDPDGEGEGEEGEGEEGEEESLLRSAMTLPPCTRPSSGTRAAMLRPPCTRLSDMEGIKPPPCTLPSGSDNGLLLLLLLL